MKQRCSDFVQVVAAAAVVDRTSEAVVHLALAALLVDPSSMIKINRLV